jgi:hypothetical protein
LSDPQQIEEIHRDNISVLQEVMHAIGQLRGDTMKPPLAKTPTKIQES